MEGRGGKRKRRVRSEESDESENSVECKASVEMV